MALTLINTDDKHPVGSKAWAERLRKDTKVLATNLDADYLRLARNLWELFDRPVDNDPKNTSWLTKWGYGKIGDFAEKELGIHRRIAERLRRVWMVVSIECKLNDEYLEKFISLGRSKARVLTRPGVMNPANAQSWIDRALVTNYVILEEQVATFLSGRADVMKGTLGKVEPLDADGDVIEDDDDLVEAQIPPPGQKTMEQLIAGEVQAQAQEASSFAKPLFGAAKSSAPAVEEKPVYKNFALFADQYDTVKAALERAAELSGSKKDGQNLSLIALDFLATNEFKKASMEQVQRFYKRLEKALEVRVIVLAPSDHEILYGYKTLEKLINKSSNPDSTDDAEEA